MKLSFNVTDDDYVRARLYVASGPLRKPIAWPPTRVIAVAILMVIGAIVLLIDSTTGRIDFGAIVIIVAAFSLALFLSVGQRSALIRLGRRSPGAIGPREVEISEEFMQTITPSQGSILRWPTLLRLEFLDGNIYYATSSLAMFIIPAHAFGSADEAAATFDTMVKYRDAAIRRMPHAPTLTGAPSELAVWPPAPAAGGYDVAMPEIGPELDPERTASVHVQLTPEDLVHLGQAQINRLTLFAFVGVAAVIALIFLVTSGPPSVPILIALVVYPLVFRLLLGRIFLRNALRNAESVRASLRDYRVLTDFVTLKIESTESAGYFALADILRVNHFRNAIGIQSSPLHQFAIPLRSFESPTNAAGFERRLRQAVKEQKQARKPAERKT